LEPAALANAMIKLYSHMDSTLPPGELGCITHVNVAYNAIGNVGLFSLAKAFAVLDLSHLSWLDIGTVDEVNSAGIGAVFNALSTAVPTSSSWTAD